MSYFQPQDPACIIDDLLGVWRHYLAEHHGGMQNKLTQEMSPTERALSNFTYDHLRPELQEVSRPICEAAQRAAQVLPAGPELTAGLRKLREAKDCLVLARVEQLRDERIRAERQQPDLAVDGTVKREG